MGLHRLTTIALGVPDVAASTRFFRDFGLTEADDGRLATRDGGAQIELQTAARRNLLRLGVGADDGDDLGAIASRTERSGLGTIVGHDDDRLLITEPVTGLVVDVSVAEPLTVPAPTPAPINSPGHGRRRNVPAVSVLADAPVQPSNLTHVVYTTPDQPTTLRFFTEVIGFEISDEIPGIIAFTRCGEVHHNLAIQQGPVAYAHHVAFEVDSVDDVARGGTAMIQADPERHLWGMGRHAIGSNWFWYLREPGGTFVEYAADVDRIDAQELYHPKQWSGHEFLYAFGPPPPRHFLEPTDLADLIAANA